MSSESDEQLLPMLDGQPGPARRIDEARAASLVAGVLERAALPAKARPRWLSLAAAGAVLALMSGAVAATIHVLRTRAPSTVELPKVSPPPRVAEPAPAAVPVVEEPPSSAEAAPVVDEPSVPKPDAPARIHTTVPAADLLAQANRLRGDKHWKDAERVYARVLRAFPDGSDAPVAAIAAGSLLLEHLASPREALEMFSTALRAKQSGPLAEEARWGIAQSYGALADRHAEQRALETFLRLHPQSVLHDRAQARLSELATH
jgi:hypothetical protein